MKKKLVLGITLSLGFACLISGNVEAITDAEWNQSFGSYYGDDDYTTPPHVSGDQSKIGFRNDWVQARDFGVKPIKEKETTIKLKTQPGALITITLKRKEAFQFPLSLYELNNEETSVAPKYSIKPTVAGWDGVATFDLKNSGTYSKVNNQVTKSKYTEAQSGDAFTVTVSLDGFRLGSAEWTVGETEARDEVEAKEKVEREKREREAKEQEERKQKEQETQKAQAEATVAGSTGQLSEGSANSQNQNEAEQRSTADNRNNSNSSDQVDTPNSNEETETSSTDWKTRFSKAWSTFTEYINPRNWFKSWWS